MITGNLCLLSEFKLISLQSDFRSLIIQGRWKEEFRLRPIGKFVYFFSKPIRMHKYSLLPVKSKLFTTHMKYRRLTHSDRLCLKNVNGHIPVSRMFHTFSDTFQAGFIIVVRLESLAFSIEAFLWCFH